MTDFSETSKPALRERAKARRAAIPDDVRDAAAAAVAEVLPQALGPVSGLIVAGYSPIQGELDCRPALRRLETLGASLALPVTLGNAPLLFRRWHKGMKLVPDAFNVPAPPLQAEIVTPDIVLVPMLAFDAALHRLGYGAGHYDRTLASLRAGGKVRAVGLALWAQRLDRLPAGPYDQRLDMIVTERGVVTPAGD